MDNWMKQAYQEQYRDRMLQEAAKERLLRRALADVNQHANNMRKDKKAILKRKIAYSLALVVLAALLVSQVVAAAFLTGGGGTFLLR